MRMHKSFTRRGGGYSRTLLTHLQVTSCDYHMMLSRYNKLRVHVHACTVLFNHILHFNLAAFAGHLAARFLI